MVGGREMEDCLLHTSIISNKKQHTRSISILYKLGSFDIQILQYFGAMMLLQFICKYSVHLQYIPYLIVQLLLNIPIMFPDNQSSPDDASLGQTSYGTTSSKPIRLSTQTYQENHYVTLPSGKCNIDCYIGGQTAGCHNKTYAAKSAYFHQSDGYSKIWQVIVWYIGMCYLRILC